MPYWMLSWNNDPFIPLLLHLLILLFHLLVVDWNTFPLKTLPNHFAVDGVALFIGELYTFVIQFCSFTFFNFFYVFIDNICVNWLHSFILTLGKAIEISRRLGILSCFFFFNFVQWTLNYFCKSDTFFCWQLSFKWANTSHRAVITVILWIYFEVKPHLFAYQ